MTVNNLDIDISHVTDRPTGRHDALALQKAKIKAHHRDLDLQPFYDKNQTVYL
jgi:hypothetical protein